MTGHAIGFLFNHAAGHQVAHSLPIAAALARLHPATRMRIFVAAGPSEMEVRRLWASFGFSEDDPRIMVLASASPAARWATKLSGGAVPLDRLSILARNRDQFRQFDALVVPEKTSTLLKTRLGLTDLALIHTRHGAGDRAIGFDVASARFDLVLMSGEKIRDRLAGAGLLKDGDHAIVGYPKFDTLRDAPKLRLFDHDKPTVLYNPHPSPALSSWYRIGPDVLRWFAGQDRYNLIFAPHVMLFAKRWTLGLSPPSLSRVPKVPAGIAGLPHIHVDLGSRASIDMSYTEAADLYLGDASSQVYEFLRRPRPCLFLNPAGHRWRDNPDFAHWRAGPVVEHVPAMAHALDAAMADPAAFAPEQRRLFTSSFDLTDRPSAERAAQAIVTWLDHRKNAE